jgi:hypothetical protein
MSVGPVGRRPACGSARAPGPALSRHVPPRVRRPTRRAPGGWWPRCSRPSQGLHTGSPAPPCRCHRARVLDSGDEKPFHNVAVAAVCGRLPSARLHRLCLWRGPPAHSATHRLTPCKGPSPDDRWTVPVRLTPVWETLFLMPGVLASATVDFSSRSSNPGIADIKTQPEAVVRRVGHGRQARLATG